MDYALLAEALTIFLAPALPYLLSAGEEAGKEAAKKIGADGWTKAKDLWGRLSPAVEEKPAALEAVEDAVAAPEDADAAAAMRLQFRKILSADPDLAMEVSALLEQAGAGTHVHAEVRGSGAVAQGQGAVAAGAGGVAVGRDVQGSVIVTGRRKDDG